MMYQMNRMTGPLEPEGRNIQKDPMPSRNMDAENTSRRPMQPPAANPDNIPVAPLPPIIGNPAPGPQPPAFNPGSNKPVIPLPPIVGNPAPGPQPPTFNPDNIPVIPLPPIVGNPAPGPQPPAAGGYSTVRFLHAIAGVGPVEVSVGIRTVANRLTYGNFSSYSRIQDGFHSVTVSSSANSNNIIFRGRIPFNADEKITLAIVKEGNAYNLVRISDQPCKNRPAARGCVRAANLIYNSPPMDVIMTDGRIAFPDVRYKEVTFFKQVWPGEYDFYVAQTSYSPTADILDIDVLNNLPVVLVNFMLPGFGEVKPLVSSYVTVRPGGNYTIYLLGDWSSSQNIMVKVAES